MRAQEYTHLQYVWAQYRQNARCRPVQRYHIRTLTKKHCGYYILSIYVHRYTIIQAEGSSSDDSVSWLTSRFCSPLIGCHDPGYDTAIIESIQLLLDPAARPAR
jgi:hypothetical protein